MTLMPASWRALLVPAGIAVPAGLARAAEPSDSGLYLDPPGGPEIDPATLEPILEELGGQVTMSAWDRLIAWLESLFGDRPDTAIPGWLRDFQFPAELWDWIFYVSCVLVVLLSVGIIANELRSRHGARRRSSSGRHPLNHVPSPAPSLEQVLALPLLDQPASLLRLILAELRLADTPGTRFSLTHREIARVADSLLELDAESIRQVARTAERIRYAQIAPEPEEIHAVIATGRRMVEELS